MSNDPFVEGVFEAHITFLETTYEQARTAARDLRAKAEAKESEGKHIREEIFKRLHGVRVGAIGVTTGSGWGSIAKGSEFRITKFDSWGTHNVPSVHGVLRKKDGTWGERECYVGAAYEIVGYDPIEEAASEAQPS